MRPICSRSMKTFESARTRASRAEQWRSTATAPSSAMPISREDLPGRAARALRRIRHRAIQLLATIQRNVAADSQAVRALARDSLDPEGLAGRGIHRRMVPSTAIGSVSTPQPVPPAGRTHSAGRTLTHQLPKSTPDGRQRRVVSGIAPFERLAAIGVSHFNQPKGAAFTTSRPRTAVTPAPLSCAARLHKRVTVERSGRPRPAE